MSVLRQTLLLLWKDVVVEARAKELVYATVFFGVIVILIFAFCFLGETKPPVDVSVGVLWVTMALAGTLGIGRAFEREREGDTLRALFLSPVSRPALYLSKICAIALLMAVVESVCAVFLSLMFQITLTEHLGYLVGLLFLGMLGFAAVAALFGASLGRARSRDVLLPLLTYPVVVPVLIAGTRGTVALLKVDDLATATWWLKFLGVFDLIFMTIGWWTFEPVMRGEA
jgi:heme exporter protein CcmB